MQSYDFYPYQTYQSLTPPPIQHTIFSPPLSASLQMSYAQQPQVNHFLEVLYSLKSADAQLRALTVDKLIDIAVPLNAAKQTIDFWLTGLKQSKHDTTAFANLEFTLKHAFGKRLRLLADSISSPAQSSTSQNTTQQASSPIMSHAETSNSIQHLTHETLNDHYRPLSPSLSRRSAAIPIVRPPVSTSKAIDLATMNGNEPARKAQSKSAPATTEDKKPASSSTSSSQRLSHAVEGRQVPGFVQQSELTHQPETVQQPESCEQPGFVQPPPTPPLASNNMKTQSTPDHQLEEVITVPGGWPDSSPAPKTPYLSVSAADDFDAKSTDASPQDSLPSPAISQQSKLSDRERLEKYKPNAARFLDAIKHAAIGEKTRNRYGGPSKASSLKLSSSPPPTFSEADPEQDHEAAIMLNPEAPDWNAAPQPDAAISNPSADPSTAVKEVLDSCSTPSAQVAPGAKSSWHTPAQTREIFSSASVTKDTTARSATPLPQIELNAQSSWWDISPVDLTSHPVLKPSVAMVAADSPEPMSTSVDVTPASAKSTTGTDRGASARSAITEQDPSKLFQQMQARMEIVKARLQAESGFMARSFLTSRQRGNIGSVDTASKEKGDDSALTTTLSASSAPLIVYVLTETLPWPARHVHAALRRRYGSTGYQLYKRSKNMRLPTVVDEFYVVIDPNAASQQGFITSFPGKSRLQLVGDRAGEGGHGFFAQMAKVNVFESCKLCHGTHPHNICRGLVPVPDDGNTNEKEMRDVDEIMEQVRGTPVGTPERDPTTQAAVSDNSAAAATPRPVDSHTVEAAPERVDTPHATDDDWATKLYEPVASGEVGSTSTSTRPPPGLFDGMTQYENTYGTSANLNSAWATLSPARDGERARQIYFRGLLNAVEKPETSAKGARGDTGNASEDSGGWGDPSAWLVPEKKNEHVWDYRESSLLD